MTMLLLVLALFCFVVAAFNWSPSPRVSPLALGLAFWVLAQLLPLVT